MNRLLRALLIASPAFVIALLGLAHPIFLTQDTAERWRLVHLAFLPGFPLLAGSLLYLLRRSTGPAAWIARIAAFGYAVLYGALDSIAGIGAPALVQARGKAATIGDLFGVGDQLGHLGVWALAASLVATSGVLWRQTRDPRTLLGGALGAACCYPFAVHHVFPPRGVLAVVGIGVAVVLIAWSDRAAAQAPS